MDAVALRARLAGGGEAPAEAIGGLATSDDVSDLADAPLRPSAVLVPLLHGAEAGVMLTVRSAALRAHAGQVAFPGGRTDPEDPSPEGTALREAWEEVGLRSEDVEVLGRLPDYVTGTGFRITPVLALVPGGLALRPSPDEVAEIFTLPMAVLLDPAAPERRSRMFRGRERQFWVWPHERHYIWGATAAILVHLAARLRAPG